MLHWTPLRPLLGRPPTLSIANSREEPFQTFFKWSFLLPKTISIGCHFSQVLWGAQQDWLSLQNAILSSKSWTDPGWGGANMAVRETGSFLLPPVEQTWIFIRLATPVISISPHLSVNSLLTTVIGRGMDITQNSKLNTSQVRKWSRARWSPGSGNSPSALSSSLGTPALPQAGSLPDAIRAQSSKLISPSSPRWYHLISVFAQTLMCLWS